MAENEKDEVTSIDTDLQSDENPFNADGYIGVDPYFQGAPIKKAKKKATAVRDDSDKDKDKGAGSGNVTIPGVTTPGSGK